jgi:hypothetical protein
MQLRHIRRGGGGREARRVLLVGFPPLMLSALEPALAGPAEVVSVPFPGSSFDRAAEVFDPDLVVVDVTYLDESVVRPLITHRFLGSKSVVVYVSEGRETPAGDLDMGSAELVGDGLIDRLVALVSGPPLKLVAEQ